MQLRLEDLSGRRTNGGAYEVVYAYNVCGLPEGHGAHIQNLDYPRDLSSVDI